jgi:hypothetical protein
MAKAGLFLTCGLSLDWAQAVPGIVTATRKLHPRHWHRVCADLKVSAAFVWRCDGGRDPPPGPGRRKSGPTTQRPPDRQGRRRTPKAHQHRRQIVCLRLVVQSTICFVRPLPPAAMPAHGRVGNRLAHSPFCDRFICSPQSIQEHILVPFHTKFRFS